MNLARRRQFVLFVLGAGACWPAVQRVLVERYLVNPWELGGLAMYVQPNTPIDVRLQMPSGEWLESKQLAPAEHKVFENYRAQASVVGVLASTNELVQMLDNGQHPRGTWNVELRRQMIAMDGKMVWRVDTRRLSVP